MRKRTRKAIEDGMEDVVRATKRYIDDALEDMRADLDAQRLIVRGHTGEIGSVLHLPDTSLTKMVERIRELLETHHEVVIVNDVSQPGGTRILTKLDVARGRTPQGQRIQEVRDPAQDFTEYHVMTGKGYTGRELRG